MVQPTARPVSADPRARLRHMGDDEITGFEERLRRSAAQSNALDPDLRSLLSFITARRGQRIIPSASGRARVVASERAPSPSEDAGRVLAVHDVGPTVRILKIGRPPGLSFRAGQNLRVGLPGNRRAKFSIASAPHELHIELCIQLIPDGRLTPALFGLRPGDTVDIADTAKGAFTLRSGHTTHLMVATGTGIAPFRSMIRDAWQRGARDRFIVLHGASYVDELPYTLELANATEVEYLATISRPTHERNRGWTGAIGRVDELARVVASTLDAATTQTYACGNRGMVDAVSRKLGALGFDVAREIYD